MKKKLNKLKAKKKLCGGRLSGYVTNLQRLRKLRPDSAIVVGGVEWTDENLNDWVDENNIPWVN